jgi:hypothetical protein
MNELRENRMMLKGMVDRLNADGPSTGRGKPWKLVKMVRGLDCRVKRDGSKANI